MEGRDNLPGPTEQKEDLYSPSWSMYARAPKVADQRSSEDEGHRSKNGKTETLGVVGVVAALRLIEGYNGNEGRLASEKVSDS